MNEMILINYDSDRPTVLGRDLHEALGIKSKYADWFKNTFSGWSMKCEEKPDKVTADRIEYGRVRAYLSLY